jgi:glycosidase
MKRILFFLFISAVVLAACNLGNAPDHSSEAGVIGHSETTVLRHPDWSANATIYEVNIRQHTPEGTINALKNDLPRLKELGVDILWLMPVHPIGQAKRKGTLGSYYSVKDYKGFNPEYGTPADFRAFMDAAHKSGMKVILDWVANHTAWDNQWISAHADWYTQDSAGQIISPVPDWSDVADLNYDNEQMRLAMIDAMKYWVSEYDVDGFRCDVAMMVPTDFWNQARISLDSLKPVFMLAEAEQKDHHLQAFDMSYTWEFLHLMNGIAKGEKKLGEIDNYLARQDTAFPRSAFRMYFTTNHDENTWNGTGGERYGKARQVYDVLALTIGGMPLLYSGQEGGEVYEDGSAHRLRFFDKDTVRWNGYPYSVFYSRLLKAHKENAALWNGEHGGSFQRLPTSQGEKVYAYSRTKGNNVVIVLLNFSDQSIKLDFTSDIPKGEYLSIFNNESLALYTSGDAQLKAYGYQVFVKK